MRGHQKKIAVTAFLGGALLGNVAAVQGFDLQEAVLGEEVIVICIGDTCLRHTPRGVDAPPTEGD